MGLAPSPYLVRHFWRGLEWGLLLSQIGEGRDGVPYTLRFSALIIGRVSQHRHQAQTKVDNQMMTRESNGSLYWLNPQ